MFRIGHWEIILLLLVLFILFGHRLPGLMRHLGRRVVAFREPGIGRVRYRQEPNTPGSLSLMEWLMILVLVALLVALLLPAWVWTN